MERLDLTARFWQIFALLSLLIIMVAAFRWSWVHPYGTHWDEAQYLNEAAIDSQRLRAGLIFKVAGRILMKSWGRPPAYRILALPFLGVAGFHTTIARLVTQACYGFSAWLIYLSTKRIAGKVGAAIAVLIFCLSPQVVSASMWFSSEGPLYLSITAMFYYLFASWTSKEETPNNWIGLGIALGFGFLSKASFLLIGLPVWAFAFVVAWRQMVKTPISSLLKAAVVGLLIAGPWWLVNLKASIAYAGYARGFVRNSLGSPSPQTWMRWSGTVLEALLGYGISLVILVVLIVFVRRSLREGTAGLTPIQKLSIGACACGGLPIIAAQLLGTNHLLRHISPSVIPLAIAVGTVASTLDWSHAWVTTGLLSAMFTIQLGILVAPIFVPNEKPIDAGLRNGSLPWRIMNRIDQWDWSAAKKIADNCGLESPTIAYIGNGRAFNDPQIQFPWAVRGTSANVTWLWRYEDGPIDWTKVLERASGSDLVLTAPGYSGEASDGEDLDNQHNSELAADLSRNPHFREPITLSLGRFQPVDVLVFVNSKLTCEVQAPATATR